MSAQVLGLRPDQTSPACAQCDRLAWSTFQKVNFIMFAAAAQLHVTRLANRHATVCLGFVGTLQVWRHPSLHIRPFLRYRHADSGSSLLPYLCVGVGKNLFSSSVSSVGTLRFIFHSGLVYETVSINLYAHVCPPAPLPDFAKCVGKSSELCLPCLFA